VLVAVTSFGSEKSECLSVGTRERLVLTRKNGTWAAIGRRGVVHPRCDRKSAEPIENGRDSLAPLRERVRNCMKLHGLHVCDSKIRTWSAKVSTLGECTPHPRVFCAKSAELPDSNALSFFESAKECATVSKERA
jgi:hypothetical protein